MMSLNKTLRLQEIETLAYDALLAAGAAPHQAKPVAAATAETEAMGVSSHGLAYIPIYVEHLRCGKVNGQAIPSVTTPKPGVIIADAANGFAHPAIDLGFEALVPAAKAQGIACLAIKESYNCGVLGCHTAILAKHGLLALGFTNAPASIAPSGGATPVVGTNPISIAAPGPNGPDVLIDQSSSAIAKSEVMKHAREGKPIPLGWALDTEGAPTTDPDAGLKGSMAPAGGYKGVGLALIVELMAAAMTGAVLGKDASPFSGPVGGPPATGQFFIAIDPSATAGGAFSDRLAALVGAIRAQNGARMPGDNRLAKAKQAAREGVKVNVATLDRIAAL